MRREASIVTCLALPFLILAATSVAPADEAERTRPSYRRDESVRPNFDRPRAGTLPELLREAREARSGQDDESAQAGVAETRPESPESRLTVERRSAIASLAAREAQWTAERIARTVGRLEYYRAGLYEGLHVALGDESLGAWDFAQGLRLGLRDPDALALGAADGARAADELARKESERQVADTFMDLAAKPDFAPRPIAPRFDPAPSWAAAPALDEIFVERIRTYTVPLSRDFLAAFDGWHHDAWGLYGCDGVESFYDAAWSSPGRGWDFWRDSSRRKNVYRQIPESVERDAFRDAFDTSFAARIPRQRVAHALGAYNIGFDEGWQIGASMLFEYRFRLGYTEGFDRAAMTAAGAEFRAAFAPAFGRHYDREFRDWSETVHPDVVEISLSDANEDGVFEPGETVVADYRIVNYGGGAGDVVVVLEGEWLDRSVDASVRVRARSSVDSGAPLRAEVRPDAPLRVDSFLVLRAGESGLETPFVVSYPLEFASKPRIERIDAVAGEARVEVSVVNTSRKPVAARVTLEPLTGHASSERRDLGRLDPGARAVAGFDLAGLEPLDLLAGDVEARFTTASASRVHDTAALRFPDLAEDLGNRELLRTLVALGDDPATTSREIARARALVLQRMRVDWQAAVRANGNPYKQDFKKGTASTALGDLVRVYAERGASAAHPGVWNGLGREIETLAEDLPGVHPRLRKFAKRLAREVG